jgi:DNA topoisomerase-1
MKCRTKREIVEPVAEFNAAGAPVTKGTCDVCGTKLYRIGRTEAHEGLTPPEKVTRTPKRSGKLVIVESPAKAKTVGRYLGNKYTVKASVGHVRDLLKSELSVDIENDFEPKYRVPNGKRKVVKELKTLAKKMEEVYLATDPDREGEAIAWHLIEAIDVEEERTKRVVFHEITKDAIEEAFSHPRQVDMDRVDAQQGRRVLDRLVGYSISPLLWKKVRGRLSAGRVQSVALRLIVEREREIEDFVPEEYWTIAADLSPEGIEESYQARLSKIDGEDPVLPNEDVVNHHLANLEKSTYTVSKVKRGTRKRKPAAPFITSTLQQEASRRLGFTAKRTMALAQQLYEGLEMGKEGVVGLITYMRTDSTNVSASAQKETRELIKNAFGAEYVPEEPPVYRTRAKGAQEAHEAIRPTSVERRPELIKSLLTRDQFRLYQLIWKRFVASQMSSAVYNTLSVEIDTDADEHRYLFRASGSVLKFKGFLVLYEEALDEDAKPENGDNVKIPAQIEENQPQTLNALLPEQHFTQPPARFSEATLVQILEEYGIGRPSTYTPILSTLLDRGYAVRDNKRLYPTETGLLVNDLLIEYFPDVFNTGFTAKMEEDLDSVSLGERQWQEVVKDFYKTFEPKLKHAQESMPETKAEYEKVGRECPRCGNDLVIRWGRFGKFISCSNFPECRYTEPWLEKIGVSCPQDGGDVVMRKSRQGRVFYGCANYPQCDFTSWKRPIQTKCPKCSGTLVIANKREAQCLNCEETFLLEQFEEGAKETA